MPSFTWSSAANGNWSLASNWTPSGVPGAAGGDTATINAKGANYTVTYDESKEVLNSLTINSATATLALNANDTLTINGATNLQAGTINLLNNIDELDAGNLSTSAGTTINIGTGNKMTFNSATLGGVVDMTGTTTFGKTNASITLNGTIEVTGGIGTLDFASISGSGTLEANGATLVVESPFNGAVLPIVMSDSSSSVFETTGTLFFGETLSASFLGTHGKVEIHDAATDSNINFNLSGLHAVAPSAAATNFLDLDGKSVTVTAGGAGTGTTGVITLSNGDKLNLTGITGLGPAGWKAIAQADGSGGTDVFLQSVCYVAGTRILTATGERAIEGLLQGDIVLTLSDGELKTRTVKWLGHRRISLAGHPQPETVAPIRIERDAFADGMPHRDLLVSPDHAIFVDGKLICARQLVNGTTIRQERDGRAVHYYHVELEQHAILLAEGLPAESYLDTGNSGFFANSGAPLVLHPDLTDETDYPTREANSCAPFVTDEANVRPVWQRLVDRAVAIGRAGAPRATTTDAGLHLQCPGGRTVKPVVSNSERVVFVLPRGAREVRLLSHAQSPTDARPWLDDRRRLGVRVKRIVLRSVEEMREVPIDHPDLTRGWWAVERDGQILSRWTDGEAVLPLPAMHSHLTLEIHLAGAMTFVEDAVSVGGAERRAAA